MAKLPPKAAGAAISSNWHGGGFDNQRQYSSMATFFCPAAAAAAAARPSWAEEFRDFSAARRSAHRRTTVGDSVAFLEPPAPITVVGAIEDALVCRSGGGHHGTHDHQFDRLDDDQLRSMFSDEAPPPAPASPSSLSTPSDHTSAASEEKGPQLLSACEQNLPEAQSPAAAQESPAPAAALIDPKRVKRILANRQSAQRSRVRKLQYISNLERSVTSLQHEVSALSPRVAFLDQQRSLLTAGNSALKQRIAALAHDKIFKDAHQEALKKEIDRLSQVYRQQSLKKMKMASAAAAAAAAVRSPHITEPIHGASNEELLS